MAFAPHPHPPAGTPRNAMFQSLKGSSEERVDSHSRLLAFLGMNSSEDKGGLSSVRRLFPAHRSLPGLSDLHRERREVRALTCLRDWLTSCPWQRFGKITMIQSPASFLQSQNGQCLANGKVHVGTTGPVSSL